MHRGLRVKESGVLWQRWFSPTLGIAESVGLCRSVKSRNAIHARVHAASFDWPSDRLSFAPISSGLIASIPSCPLRRYLVDVVDSLDLTNLKRADPD